MRSNEMSLLYWMHVSDAVNDTSSSTASGVQPLFLSHCNAQ